MNKALTIVTGATYRYSRSGLELGSYQNVKNIYINQRIYLSMSKEILVEHPENSQHPRDQIKAARKIAEVLYEGIFVAVVTNSIFILNDLANLIMLGGRGDLGREQACILGYNPHHLLQAENVDVWTINERGVAEKELVTGDHGFRLKHLDDVLQDTEYTAQEIYAGADPEYSVEKRADLARKVLLRDQ